MGGNRFRLKPCTLAAASISLLFVSPSLWANPTGPQVISGQVNFQQPSASVLNVTNSSGAIINWQGFSIGASEVTRFVQQSATSSVLNRVTGGNVSQIYGQLLSNGRVFLINPGGIVVGPGAIVDTAGFVASTLNMLDSDFLNGKLRFQGDASSGSIINQGWIRTGYGGHVLLVAPTIENSGLIHTPGGDLILAAGQKVTMSTLDLAGVQLEVQAPTDSVVNVGKLLADGGAVGVFAGTLRHTGEIRANSLVYDEAGKVVLKAQNEIQLAGGSATSADGKSGGSITVQSGGSTRVAGGVSATGTQGLGGSISVLGDRVALVESAALNASGSTGGGQILVGGDYQGANPAIQNSTNTFISPTASLKADATQNGDGGRLIVWSDGNTQAYGSLSAQGGPQGGNGGFAEISGKQGLVFQGSASLGAPQGGPGTLLLDPLDLYVFAGGGIDLASINELTEFPANAATVSPATLDAAGASVVLQASRYMRISDAITLNTLGAGLTATVSSYTAPALPDPLALSTSTPNRLELAAGITTVSGAVTLNAPTIQSVAATPISIATSGGAINLSATDQISGFNLALNAGTGAVSATNTGATNAFGSISLGGITGSTFTATAPSFISTSSITTTGSVSETSTLSSVNTGTLSAGNGAVSLTGSGVFGTVNTTGAVTLTSSSSISATVNGSESLAATGSGFVSINSTTDVKVANVTSTNSTAQINTSGGSIRGTSPSSTVKGFDVSLFTAAGTGGGIGIAGTALNVDTQRNFTFRPNGDFNILLTGTGPTQLNAQLTPASSGTYTGTLTKQGGGLTLNASADTTTVTVSSLNITSGFDQFVGGSAPSIQVQTTNNANLVATSVAVPTGDTSLTSPAPLPVTLGSNTGTGSLTVTSYTRAGGGPAKATTFNGGSSGTVTLGSVDASKDTVIVNGSTGITVDSLISTGDITLNSFSGAVNPQIDSPPVDISSGGTLTINGRGIGTIGPSFPLDLAGAKIILNSFGFASGPIGGASPVTANTQDLTVNAGSGSTFNVSTGATSLTNLNVTANATSVGDAGVAQVSTASGAAIYVFDANAGQFTFNPPASASRNITFTSSSGDILLGATSLGTGNLTLASNNGKIDTSGAAISAAAVTLNAGTDINAGAITASVGDIALHGRNNVTAGALNTPAALTVDGSFGCSFCSPAVSVGIVGGTSAPSAVTMRGDTVATGAITSTSDITLSAAGGALTLSGALTTADGKTMTLRSNDVAPLSFTQINAGATGTVNITSFGGIQQTADGSPGDGITAKTVVLSADNGPIKNTADGPFARLDLLGTTNLTIITGNEARFDLHGSALTDLAITKTVLPASGAFDLANAGGQTVTIGNTGAPFELSVNSPTALNFSLSQTVAANDIKLIGGGVVTSGGNVILTSAGGINVSGALNAGAGTATLSATGGSITGASPITSSLLQATTANGEINLGGTITAPTVTLTAVRPLTALANEGLITATLGSTTNLTLSGDFGFNVSSDTGFNTLSVATKGTGTGAVNLTASGQTYSFSRPATDLFGTNVSGTAFEVVSVNAPSTTATFRATDGMLLVRGDGTNKLNVQTLTLASTNAGDVVLQGNSANPLTLSQPTQTFNVGTGDLRVTGAVTITGASQTFMGAPGSGTMVFQGGTAANEKVTVSSTNSQFVQTQSTSLDAFKLLGGSGADSSVTFTHSGAGSQTFQMSSGTLTVAGGSGQNSFAKLEETGTTEQRVCFISFSFCSPILSLNVLGGSGAGAFAQITSAGSQRLEVSGTALNTGTLVKGGSGDGAYALVQAAATQQIGSSGRLQVEAGASNGSFARIAATGSQTIFASNLSLIAKGTEGAPLQNASAIIEGNGQNISIGTGITINAGSGTSSTTTSDALIRNTAGSQTVATSGALILDGGHEFSTAGILNLGTAAQTVTAGSGITLRSDTDSPGSPHSNAFVAIQNQPATLQNINAGAGGLRLTNSGGGTVSVTSGSDQRVQAQFVEVLTNPSTEAGPNSATISAATHQHIITTNSSTSGFPSMRVAALGTGTASVESLGSQLLELDYPSQMQFTNRDGRLIIGDEFAVGTSRVRAGDPAVLTSLANQTIFAQSITVQGGGGANSISELKATGVQVISTLNGDIDVLGGSGANSLASIDPVTQILLVNGSVNVIGGSGANAIAQIVNGTGTQTILATDGSVIVTGGSAPGADAIISSLGLQAIGASGSVIATPTPGAGNAIIGAGSSSGPSSSASTVVASATTPILTVEENLELVLVELTPEGIGQDPLLTRRAPGCL